MTDHYEKARAEKWSLSELPSLTGKTALITGANSPESLGWHIAYHLVLKGAKVHVGARSAEKAASGIEAMIAAAKGEVELSTDMVKPFVADLSNLKEVKTAANKFVEEEERLDILVNNAGVLPGPITLDAHGISKPFVTNHLGPFLLTKTLLPLLISTSRATPNSDVRIINISSTAHFDAPPTSSYSSLSAINALPGPPDDPVTQYQYYGYTKLANVLFTKSLQHHFTASLQHTLSSNPSNPSNPPNTPSSQNPPILAMSLHPGGVGTEGAARFLGGRDNDTFKGSYTPFEGAITGLFAAAHPEPRLEEGKYRGAFLLPWGGVKEANHLARDKGLRRELWDSSERLVGGVLGSE